MGRFDRRTFLSNGLKAGAALAVIGAGDIAVGVGSPSGSAGAAGAPVGGAPGPPSTLTTTGVTRPVGVDPDDVMFAWQVTDPRRGARQHGYRIVVSGPDDRATTVWDSGPVDTGNQAFVVYDGPSLSAHSRYRWTVATADGRGRWSRPSAPAVFTTGLRDGDWTAQWLRPGPPEPGQEEYTYLRSTHVLPRGTVAYASAFVAGAHKYQLWVNGHQVDTGPSFCFPDEQYYQATDVTAVLAPGRTNAIGVLHHWYGPGRGRPSSAPGLLLQVAVHYTDGTVVTLGTDRGWRTRRAEWLPAPQRNTDAGDFVEWIDGRLHPTGWSTPDFDDSGWTAAAVLGPVGTEPFTHLYAQRTRISQHEVGPVSVRTLPTGSVVADFGKVYAGRPTVSFRDGTDGHTVPMHVGYTLDPDGSVSTTHNTQGTDLSFLYIQRPGAQTVDPYWYLGFRYLQIDDPGEPLADGQIALVARHATMPDGREATFRSSDPTLDAVWALCAHSGLYTSQEQFIDTPTREKGQFLWDAANESQTVMRAFGDQNLSWQGLRDQARAQARYWPTGQLNEIYPNDDGAQDYPTFTALYPEWVWRYYLSTGDRATLATLLPTLVRLSDYLAGTIDPSTGLVSGLSITTNGDDDYGYDYDTDADTTLNILVVNAFRRIGSIAALVGTPASSSAADQRGTELTTAVNAHLVGIDGLYVDGLRADGRQSTHYSQQANLAALTYGVVPAALAPTVARYVASLDISVEPDQGMELLRALHAGGRDADVVRILTDASFPGWAAILKSGGTFTWEAWTPSDLIGDSMSHGWGSSALVAMQEVLLGAASGPPTPGGPPVVVVLTPPTAGLAHVGGTFATPAGEFSIAWRSSTGGTGLTVTVPPNAQAHCRVAGGAATRATERGTPVSHVDGIDVVEAGPGEADLVVGAGTYELTLPLH